MNAYELFWMDGESTIVEGETLSEAFIKAGLTPDDASKLVDYRELVA